MEKATSVSYKYVYSYKNFNSITLNLLEIFNMNTLANSMNLWSQPV